jgi:hypothetical protein
VVARGRFAVFEAPGSQPLDIEPTPRLESWMGRDHADQQRLRVYLDWLEPRVALGLLPGCNALGLTVAVPTARPLDSGGGDLDNYLLPVVRRLGHQRFVSASASKRHVERSSIAVGPAVLAPLPDPSWQFASAETSEPKDSAAWKHNVDAQIRAQVAEHVGGPVEIQIAYVIEPDWNWAELWKPTIDALGAIVGDGPRPFHPLDDRIVRLALHRTTKTWKPRRTRIGVWWRAPR